MLDLSTLAVFAPAVLALALTPGPDMLLILGTGLARGRPSSVAACLGVAAGLLLVTLATAFGVAAAVAAHPVAFDLIRALGIAYLLRLAWSLWRAPDDAGETRDAGTRDLGAAFRRGLVTNLTNPKILIFFLGFLPQFADPADGPLAPQLLLLGVVLTGLGSLVNLGVALLSGRIGAFLRARPGLARVQNRVLAALFLGLAARLAFLERP